MSSLAAAGRGRSSVDDRRPRLAGGTYAVKGGSCSMAERNEGVWKNKAAMQDCKAVNVRTLFR